jgi:hypothetical protein
MLNANQPCLEIRTGLPYAQGRDKASAIDYRFLSTLERPYKSSVGEQGKARVPP